MSLLVHSIDDRRPNLPQIRGGRAAMYAEDIHLTPQGRAIYGRQLAAEMLPLMSPP